jgi:hypothetical protein
MLILTSFSRRALVLGGVAAGLVPKLVHAEDASESAPSPPPESDTAKPKQLSPAQQLEHVAVLLRAEDSQERQFSGTGFFYNFFRSGDQAVTAVVTNRHVVDGMAKIQMRWTRKRLSNEPDYGSFVDVVIEKVQERVLYHPDNNIDLAVIAVSDLLNNYQSESKPIYVIGIDESSVSSEEDLKKFQPLEDIVVVGYPDGISDTANNIPIFRRGVTATPVYMRFDNKKQFMIDAAIYHGSSGSPVFRYNVGVWLNESGAAQLGTHLSLLGVVWGVIETTTEGEMRIAPAPTQFATKIISNIPHNLGLCIPAYCILDFEPEIVKRGYKPPEGYKMRAQP